MRFAIAMAAGAVAILAVSAWWNLGVQRDHLTEFVHASADRVSDVVLRSTRDAMMREDREAVRRIVRAIGEQPGVDGIRLFDKRGHVRVAAAAEEEGLSVERGAEPCIVCHRNDETIGHPERGQRLRVFDDPVRGRALSIMAPVLNQPDCSTASCHAHRPEQSVLGVLDVQFSLARVDADLAASQRHMGVGIFATTVAMLSLAFFLMWRFVLHPVRRLEGAMAAVASGDLGARAPVTSSDEIGALTTSWNEVVSDLERARRELEGWNRTLETRVEETTRELAKAHRNMAFVEKMASLGKLAAIVAHEINNPLAGIATYARLLRKRFGRQAEAAGSTLDAETGKALDLVETEALRCGDIVRNLLLFSRSRAASFSEEDVKPCLERCALLLRHTAELQGVKISVEAPADLPRIVCDGAQVQQALVALATNGLEAMLGGGSLHLRAQADPDPRNAGGLLLEVQDTGTGIAEKDLPHIYEPFFTTKEQGKGVGLGLAVVYGIVTGHGGSIDVRTSPGRGTTFRLHLPRRPSAAADAAQPAASPGVASGVPA